MQERRRSKDRPRSPYVRCPWAATPTSCSADCPGRQVALVAAPLQETGDSAGQRAAPGVATTVTCDRLLASVVQRGACRRIAPCDPRHVIADDSTSDHTVTPELRDSASRCVRVARALIDERFSQRIRVQDLARSAGCTREHLSRRFRHETGRTIREHIALVRLARAEVLLRQGEKAWWVGLAVGFRSRTSFCRRFQSVFGVLPGHFKKRVVDV